MICKHCSTENEESAIFCKNCGKRLDGKKPCPKCKALIDENAVYCTVCGTRIDGKTVCTNCGTVYDGKFCPTCGQQEKKTVDIAPITKTNTNNSHTKLILNRVGLCLGFAGAALAFIFMFLIGFGFSGDIEALSYELNVSPQFFTSMSIFDCFGNNFNAVKQITASSPNSGAIVIIPILQTVIAVATLICTTTFFIFTIYRFVKTLCGQQTKSVENMIFGTVMSFVVGTLCFKSIMYLNYSINDYYYNRTFNVHYGLTGTTVVGIVMSLIACALMIGFKLAANGKSLRGNLLFQTISSAAIMIVALILLLCLNGQFTLKADDGVFNFGFPVIVFICIANNAPSYVGIIGYITTLLLIAMLTTIVIYSAIKTIDVKNKSAHGIIFASITLGLSIVFLLFSILTIDTILKIRVSFNAYISWNALPIFGIIISAAILIMEIVYIVYAKNNTAKSN